MRNDAVHSYYLRKRRGGEINNSSEPILRVSKKYDVGLLDVDVHGPNLSDILGGNSIGVENEMLIPAEADGLKYVSMGQIASEGHAINLGG